MNRRKLRLKKESVTTNDKENLRSQLSDDGDKINYPETQNSRRETKVGDCKGNIDACNEQKVHVASMQYGGGRELKTVTKTSETKQLERDTCTEPERDKSTEPEKDNDNYLNSGRAHVLNERCLEICDRSVKKNSVCDSLTGQAGEGLFRKTEKETETQEESVNVLAKYKHKKKHTKKKKVKEENCDNKCKIDSVHTDTDLDKEHGQSHNIQTVQHRELHSRNSNCALNYTVDGTDTNEEVYFDNTPYVPSWLCDLENDEMERHDLKLKLNKPQKHTKHSKSHHDTSINGEILTKTKDGKFTKSPDKHVKPLHEDIEKEYFKLKKALHVNDSSQDTSREISSTIVAESTGRAYLSDTAIPSYKQLFESDELGINHFKKHIHNVKVSNKKYRRTLKSIEPAGAGTNVSVTKQTKRKLLGFKPLYERKRTELTMELTADD